MRITDENHSSNIVIATFVSNSFHSLGLSHARIIHATIISMKHTTKIRDMIILVRAHIIVGNAFVESSPLSSQMQSQIMGKLVLSFTQLHFFHHCCCHHCCHHQGCVVCCAYTYVSHIGNTNNHANKYDNILFFIKLEIKK